MRHPGWVIAALALATLLAGCGGGPEHATLSGRACLARLAAQQVQYRPVEWIDAPDARCHVDTPVEVSRVEQRLNRPATLSCALASRLDDFDREVVQKLAREAFGVRVVRLDQMGAFTCRAIRGRSRLSQHALGRAIDIGGFRLADGSTISVAHDWAEPGPKRDFLRR